MPAPKKTENIINDKVIKSKALTVDINQQVIDNENIVIRFENVIMGKCNYYNDNGNFPKYITMNGKVFKKMILTGLTVKDKCLECDIKIDNGLDNNTITFS